jgi:hypothetical protein
LRDRGFWVAVGTVITGRLRADPYGPFLVFPLRLQAAVRPLILPAGAKNRKTDYKKTRQINQLHGCMQLRCYRRFPLPGGWGEGFTSTENPGNCATADDEQRRRYFLDRDFSGVNGHLASRPRKTLFLDCIAIRGSRHIAHRVGLPSGVHQLPLRYWIATSLTLL